MQFVKTLKLDDISEYEFELVKSNAIIENEEDIDIYLKVIKRNKIKESIFCYWCTIYNEEVCEKDENKKTILNKVVISELTKKRYQQSIFLQIENNVNKILEFGTEINFIEINNFIEETGLSHLQETFNEDEVLMIGTKPNINKKDAK